jgi:DNA-3-methyladenine glycosylase I
MDDTAPIRCAWAGSDPLYLAYHDREWGVPVHDDRLLFEFLTLEGAQAGLSWITILRKREAYRAAFAGFDPEAVARFDGGAWKSIAEIPASTPLSDTLSRDLKRRGFRFVGSTICYAHMQAVGMVNDHTVDCFRWRELGAE